MRLGGMIYMENNYYAEKKLSNSILATSIIQIVFAALQAIFILIVSFAYSSEEIVEQILIQGTVSASDIDEIKDLFSTDKALIIAALLALLIVGCILLMLKKKIGVILYFAAAALNIIFNFVFYSFGAVCFIFVPLILLILMTIFVSINYKKCF